MNTVLSHLSKTISQFRQTFRVYVMAGEQHVCRLYKTIQAKVFLILYFARYVTVDAFVLQSLLQKDDHDHGEGKSVSILESSVDK